MLPIGQETRSEERHKKSKQKLLKKRGRRRLQPLQLRRAEPSARRAGLAAWRQGAPKVLVRRTLPPTLHPLSHTLTNSPHTLHTATLRVPALPLPARAGRASS